MILNEMSLGWILSEISCHFDLSRALGNLYWGEPMAEKFASLDRRLTKVEQELTSRERRRELANCTCREVTVALPNQIEEFEAEMNRTCPAHGFRRLGQILALSFVKPDRTVTEESIKLAQLLEKYELALSELPPSGIGFER